MVTLIKGMETSNKSNRKKSVGYYVTRSLQSLLRAAGISPHFKPELEHLPTLSLINVEICHLFFHHILPSMMKCSKESMKYFNHLHVRNILESAWNKLIKHDWRPKLSPKTAMKNSNCGTAVQLKSLLVYQTSFEFVTLACCLGFRNLELNMLKKFIQWIGRTYAPTKSNQQIEQLISECHQICHGIELIPSMRAEFVTKPSLRIWRNLVDINWYWLDLPNHYFGLMYENKHQFTKYFYLTKSKSTVKHMIKNRLLKDITAQAMGCKQTNAANNLGSGIKQLWLNYTNDNRMTESVHKIESYNYNANNKTFVFEQDNDSLIQSPFIGMLQEKFIESKTWISLRNRIDKSNKRLDWPTNLENIDINDLTKELNRNKMAIICKYIKCIVNAITIETETYNLNNRINLFMNDLITGVITLSRFDGFQTFYREWTDSNVRINDCVWFRQPHCDAMMTTQLILHIKGLIDSSLSECLNNNFTKYNDNELYILNGPLWCNNEKQTYNINFQNIDINHMPQIKQTSKKTTISLEWVVQKLYVAHDHIIPSKQDQHGIYETNKPWPDIDENHLPSKRHINININPPKNLMSWCGMGWICNCDNAQVNCSKCLQTQEHAGGNIIFECQTTQWPYYKAYSIYQGFIPRLFSARSINELS